LQHAESAGGFHSNDYPRLALGPIRYRTWFIKESTSATFAVAPCPLKVYLACNSGGKRDDRFTAGTDRTDGITEP
jgi:hypothetical protein